MITFTEGEPFVSSGSFAPTRQTLVPVHMVKDGAEYFVANISVTGGNYTEDYNRRQMEGYKTQLLQTGGRYFKFNGQYDNPEDMIAEMLERGHTFVQSDDLFLAPPPGSYGAGFTDFHGNRNEVSAAFHYRVFDRAYADRLRAAVKPITDGRKRKRR